MKCKHCEYLDAKPHSDFCEYCEDSLWVQRYEAVMDAVDELIHETALEPVAVPLQPTAADFIRWWTAKGAARPE